MIKARLNRIEKLIHKYISEIDYSDMRIVKFIFDIHLINENDIEGLLLHLAKIFMITENKTDNIENLMNDRELDKTAIDFLHKNKKVIFNRICNLAEIEQKYFEADADNIYMEGELILTKYETEKAINELFERGKRKE
jgi:2-keto-4-pentenoate hydratase/2-oxohepta-3-ene-1,7-dioic acid hydratase in catechol pathway